METQPAPEPAPVNGIDLKTTEHYDWDRTGGRDAIVAQREQDAIISRTPFPVPDSKTLPFPKFCAYWNDLIQQPVSKYARIYVRRWFPVLLPEEIEDAKSGLTRESHPSEKKYTKEDGPLDEKKLLSDIGVGDYTFRLNDSRRPWDQATVVHGEKLSTMRNWDVYPPWLDYKRLDWDDDANRVFIKWAQSRGKLPQDRDTEKEQADMAQANVVETVMNDARLERARADQLQKEATEKAEREARDAKEALARAQAAKPIEPVRPTTDLEAMGGVIVSLVNAVKPNPDNSLSDYLKLEAAREETRRAQEAAEREAARESAKAERKRADDLQAEVLADLRKKADAPPPAAATVPAPRTDVDVLEEMVKKQNLLKQLTGRGGATEEVEKPANIDKWLEAAPIVGPIVQSFVQGIFQTIHFGLQTWQSVAYNNALLKNGEQPKPPAVQNPPEPGKPIQPQGPPLTPEQQAQQARLILMLTTLEKAAETISNCIDDGDTGVQFAEIVLKTKRRPAYDMIRSLGETSPGVYDFETFKANLGNLLNHPGRGPETAKLWEKVAPLSTFGQFLVEFFNYDAIMAEQEKQNG
jgi:hypothetical protein